MQNILSYNATCFLAMTVKDEKTFTTEIIMLHMPGGKTLNNELCIEKIREMMGGRSTVVFHESSA